MCLVLRMRMYNRHRVFHNSTTTRLAVESCTHFICLPRSTNRTVSLSSCPASGIPPVVRAPLPDSQWGRSCGMCGSRGPNLKLDVTRLHNPHADDSAACRCQLDSIQLDHSAEWRARRPTPRLTPHRSQRRPPPQPQRRATLPLTAAVNNTTVNRNARPLLKGASTSRVHVNPNHLLCPVYGNMPSRTRVDALRRYTDAGVRNPQATLPCYMTNGYPNLVFRYIGHGGGGPAAGAAAHGRLPKSMPLYLQLYQQNSKLAVVARNICNTDK